MASNTAMWRIGWRSVVAHKVRFGLTVIAVVLGTAFVAGSLMFTSALGATFDQAVNKAFYNIDAVARGAEQPIAREDLDRMRAMPDIDTVYVHDTAGVVLAHPEKNKAIQTGSMPTTVGVWYEAPSGEGVVDTVTLKEGKAPQGAQEVAVPESSLQLLDRKVGDSLLVVGAAGRFEVNIVGSYSDAGLGEPGIKLLMAEPDYLDRYAKTGITTLLARSDALDDQSTAQRLQEAFPQFTIKTGTQFADDITGSFKQSMAFMTYFLVAFGLIALVVGTFIIANTFSMLVAQRIKEFALLRALGISRSQLRASVTFEALVVGLIGSLLGVLGGIGLVAGIRAIMGMAGVELSGMGLGVTPRSVIVPLVLGVVVTLISAWVPASRAASVRPVEAMRVGAGAGERLHIRTLVGAALLVIGAGFAVSGVLFDDQTTKFRAILVGVGALAAILGVFFASAAASIPVISALGTVIGAPFKTMGRIAKTNSRRTPKRTATTAFALTLGVALVTLIGMFSATLDNSIRDLSENEINVDYILMGPATGELPLPEDTVQRVKDAPGVAGVNTLAYGIGALEQPPAPGAGQNPGSFLAAMDGDASKVYNIDQITGSMDLSGPDRMVVSQDVLRERGWELGQRIPLFNATGSQVADVEITGAFGSSKVMKPITLSTATFEGRFLTSVPVALFANGEPGVDKEELRHNLERAVEDSLYVRVQSPDEFADQQVGLVKNMMNILYGLLALAVIIAIIGIINTLALNVIERRQEIGMLRAVGMQRSQVRGMITLESVQIALYGAVLGVGLGLGIGAAFLKVLQEQGLNSLSVPYLEIGLVLIGSAIVGVIAAVWPAHRAASTPPLDAMVD